MSSWNLVDEKRVRDNSFEIRVCECYIDIAIKYFQKSDVLWGNFSSYVKRYQRRCDVLI